MLEELGKATIFFSERLSEDQGTFSPSTAKIKYNTTEKFYRFNRSLQGIQPSLRQEEPSLSFALVINLGEEAWGLETQPDFSSPQESRSTCVFFLTHI